jgi:hypothetical protein
MPAMRWTIWPIRPHDDKVVSTLGFQNYPHPQPEAGPSLFWQRVGIQRRSWSPLGTMPRGLLQFKKDRRGRGGGKGCRHHRPVWRGLLLGVYGGDRSRLQAYGEIRHEMGVAGRRIIPLPLERRSSTRSSAPQANCEESGIANIWRLPPGSAGEKYPTISLPIVRNEKSREDALPLQERTTRSMNLPVWETLTPWSPVAAAGMRSPQIQRLL